MIAPYVVIKAGVTILEYATVEHPNLITSYLNNVQKIRLTLPIINNVQQVIPSTGTWTVTLYNHREEQRQSISKALRPKADL